MVGCLAASCNDLYLTMKVSPPGSGTIILPTGNPSGPYSANDPIGITATAYSPYHFFCWTVVPARTVPPYDFDDATDPTTNYYMAIVNATVTAHFVGPLDHFTGYLVNGTQPISEFVYLQDQFGAVNATVGSARGFWNPAQKWHGNMTTPVYNPDHHLTVYNITYGGGPHEWGVVVNNQFGTQNFTVRGPVALAVPTQKVVPGNHEPPVGLDHFLLYEVIGGQSVNVGVSLQDEFDTAPQQSQVYYPIYFANPVKKIHDGTVTNITNLDTYNHLVVYVLSCKEFAGDVQIVNQFGRQTLHVYTSCVTEGYKGLVVPSAKLSWQLLQ